MKPTIAVIMDENTSGDGLRYDTSKHYFQALIDAGGLPFGVPYHAEVIDSVVERFDGLLSVGGRFSYPKDWYLGEEGASTPDSDRFDVERIIMSRYLEADKPVLGICAGMQMLGCLHGSQMTPDVHQLFDGALNHDERGFMHKVQIDPNSKLANIVGTEMLEVNTFHREALATLGSGVSASAFAEDGVIEAIEVPTKSYAVGVQWHQELLSEGEHPGNLLFSSFVDAC